MKEIAIIEQIEQRVEECYIKLAELEIEEKSNSCEYQDYFQILTELLDKEKNVFKNLTHEDFIKLKKYSISKCIITNIIRTFN